MGTSATSYLYPREQELMDDQLKDPTQLGKTNKAKVLSTYFY